MQSALRWRCAIVVADNGRQEVIHCRPNDISVSGLSVVCHRNIAISRAATVYLLIDPGNGTRSRQVVEAQGRVMENVLSGLQGGYRLGIQFTKFARDGKQLLQQSLPGKLADSASASRLA